MQRGLVTELEKQNAELLVLKTTQRESFAELFNKLENNSGEEVKHDLAKFSPFVDKDSAIRFKGRLNKARTSEDLKRPILFSAKNHAVVRLSRGTHEPNHHVGTEYVTVWSNSEYW